MDTLKTLIGYKKFTSNQSYSRKSVHLIFTTAILYFWRMWTSRDNESGTIEKLDPKNMGIAVGILLLCALKLEICRGSNHPPLAGKRRKKSLPGQGLTVVNCWLLLTYL